MLSAWRFYTREVVLERRRKIDIWSVTTRPRHVCFTTSLVTSTLPDPVQTVSVNVLSLSAAMHLVYISNMVQSVANSTYRQGLRSSTCPTFVVPRTRTKLGERAFSVSGHVAWNVLQATIRNTTDSKLFKRGCLSHIFITASLTSLPKLKLCWLCNTL